MAQGFSHIEPWKLNQKWTFTPPTLDPVIRSEDPCCELEQVEPISARDSEAGTKGQKRCLWKSKKRIAPAKSKVVTNCLHPEKLYIDRCYSTYSSDFLVVLNQAENTLLYMFGEDSRIDLFWRNMWCKLARGRTLKLTPSARSHQQRVPLRNVCFLCTNRPNDQMTRWPNH